MNTYQAYRASRAQQETRPGKASYPTASYRQHADRHCSTPSRPPPLQHPTIFHRRVAVAQLLRSGGHVAWGGGAMTRPRAIAGLGRQHLRSRQALSRGGTHWRDTSMADLVEVAPEAARLPCPGRRPAERWGTTMQIASLPHPPPAAQHPRPLAAPTLAQKPTCTCVRERVHRDRQKEQGKGLKWGGAERGHRKAQTPGGSPQASAQVFPPPQPPPPQPPPPH